MRCSGRFSGSRCRRPRTLRRAARRVVSRRGTPGTDTSSFAPDREEKMSRPQSLAASPSARSVCVLLCLAMHLKRNGFVEFEHRPAVQCGKRLTVDLEFNGHDRTFGPAVDLLAFLSVAADSSDPGIPEDRRVEPGGLFGLIVEPQARGDFLHGYRSDAVRLLRPGRTPPRSRCRPWKELSSWHALASLIRSDAHLAEALDRIAGAEIFQLEQLADLDLAFLAVARGIGEAFRPLDRLLPRLRLDARVAGDEFLGLGEGPVDERALLSGIFYAPAFRACLQPGGVEQRAGLCQLLVVIGHLGDELFFRHDAGLRVLGGLDDDHESHGLTPFRFRDCDLALARSVPARPGLHVL